MEVFLALDIPPFVMDGVNGKPRSSLFIESTDSMINETYQIFINKIMIEIIEVKCEISGLKIIL